MSRTLNRTASCAAVLAASLVCTSAFAQTKVPLGGASAANNVTQDYKVRVPPKNGGSLRLSVTGNAAITAVSDPGGNALTVPGGSTTDNTWTIGQNKAGWYKVTVTYTGPGNYTLNNTFTQVGTSQSVPWNFWYFPLKPGGTSLHLFDSPGAMTKYDSNFALGTATFDWESDTDNDHKKPTGLGWEGHCWGSALASVSFQQPAAIAAGTGIVAQTQDEMEGLSSEYMNNFGTAAKCWGMPFSKPASDNKANVWAHKFHTAFEELMLLGKKGALLNLRQAGGTGTEEVWNQGCYTYTAKFVEDPNAAGTDDQKSQQIQITNDFVCNDDFLSGGVSTGNPKDNPKLARTEEAVYVLVYGNDGVPIPNGALAGNKQNWSAMKLTGQATGGALTTPVDVFIPSCVMDVSAAAKQFKDGAAPVKNNDGITYKNNPNVTAARLKDGTKGQITANTEYQ